MLPLTSVKYPRPSYLPAPENGRKTEITVRDEDCEGSTSRSNRGKSISKAMSKEIRRKSMKMRSLKARKDAILKFNMQPKLAIEYLREHGGIICNPREFAEWIYEFIESLSKKKIGEVSCSESRHDGLRQLVPIESTSSVDT